MTTNQYKKPIGPKLFDILSDESIEVLKKFGLCKFGYIYKDPKTGQNHMRRYQNNNKLKSKKNVSH